MSEQRPERCETCRFWDLQDISRSDGNSDPFAYCRRNQPVLSLGLFDRKYQTEFATVNDPEVRPEPVEGVWPATGWDDWCGEWQAAKPGA